MVWDIILSILMAIISYVTTKKGDAKNEGKAMAAAAAAGLGTYWFTNETEWGKDSVSWLNKNIANLDGTTPTTTGGGAVKTDADGKVVSANTGTRPGSSNTNAWDVLKGWGATGTATVIGTGAVAGGLLSDNWVKWALIGVGVYILLK